MLAPLSWLKDYVDIDVTPKELEEKLFSCGFEVEELIEVGKDISNVVVGLVESCEPIPDTHLSLCQVNAGEHGTFQICCGADNVRAGGKYPLALVGATVYATAKDHVTIEGVMTIKKGKLRGYESYGMLCSGTELGLNEDLYPGAGYNGLLVLPEDAKAVADVKPILGMDDWIFDMRPRRSAVRLFYDKAVLMEKTACGLADFGKLRRRDLADLGSKASLERLHRLRRYRNKKLVRPRRHLRRDGKVKHRAGQAFNR